MPRSVETREPVSVGWLLTLVMIAALAVEGAILLHNDLQQLRPQPSRASRKTSPQHQAAQGDGSLPSGSSSLGAPEPPPPPPPAVPPAAALPKVALLFLTRGPMPLEPIWVSFLAAAPALGPASPGSREDVVRRRRRRGGAGTASASEPAWWTLFSLYIHPPPGFAYPPASLFAGHEVPGRVAVEWGQHSVVEAERALLAAALADPLNQRFVLLSDSCVPLYPPAWVYWQLVSEQRSRVNACRNDSDPNESKRLMDHRWHPTMLRAGVRKEHWRKSGQWFMLVRRHAELVAADTAVNAVFSKECWASKEPPIYRFCVSDEHYLPTLLATVGLDRGEGEVECRGVLTHARWDGPYFHPATYGKGQATAKSLAQMRGEGCQLEEGAGRAAREGIAAARQRLQERQLAGAAEGSVPGSGGSSRGSEIGGERSRNGSNAGGGDWAREAFRALASAAALSAAAPLAPSCPLFGRKVAADAATEWERVLEPVLLQRRRL